MVMAFKMTHVQLPMEVANVMITTPFCARLFRQRRVEV